MAALSFVFAATLRDLRRTGVMGVGGILLSALAVLVAGATLAGLETFGRLTAAWRSELRIVAILGEASPAASRSAALVAAVAALPGVGSVRYVSTGDALADLRRYLGPSGTGLDRLAVNPVPARIEVTPLAGLRAAELRDLIETLERVPGVDEVQAAIGWVGETERLERALRIGGFGLATILGVTTILVVAGATVLARRGRADETAVLRLAGVPETRLWAPLLLQALMLGGAGAALGLSVLLLGSEGSTPWIAGWLQPGLGLAPLPEPSGRITAALFGAGVGVGLAGGLGGGRP